MLLPVLLVYHFNPYAFNGNTEKIYLKAIEYRRAGAARLCRPKNLIVLHRQLFHLAPVLNLLLLTIFTWVLKLGLRKLFTDYLDDVSTTYADPNDLLAGKRTVIG